MWSALATMPCRRALAAMWATSSTGSEKACSATDCIGPARLGQDWLATPRTRWRISVPRAPAGKRAAPIRQPPSARLLLSPVVTTVRSGITSAGLSSRALPSKTTSR